MSGIEPPAWTQTLLKHWKIAHSIQTRAQNYHNMDDREFFAVGRLSCVVMFESNKPQIYQFVTEPSLRRRCGASQNSKLCLANSSSLTSMPRPGASETG